MFSVPCLDLEEVAQSWIVTSGQLPRGPGGVFVGRPSTLHQVFELVVRLDGGRGRPSGFGPGRFLLPLSRRQCRRHCLGSNRVFGSEPLARGARFPGHLSEQLLVEDPRRVQRLLHLRE